MRPVSEKERNISHSCHAWSFDHSDGEATHTDCISGAPCNLVISYVMLPQTPKIKIKLQCNDSASVSVLPDNIPPVGRRTPWAAARKGLGTRWLEKMPTVVEGSSKAVPVNRDERMDLFSIVEVLADQWMSF
ncbi:uncharacterized protein LOC117712814 [Arvicanthis niloticus]|uniref:uncharacterized protein LOC117712814 n=1 Tax=Arvicanthis niloticus TaxID=61156 RepID=UPI00402BD22B